MDILKLLIKLSMICLLCSEAYASLQYQFQKTTFSHLKGWHDDDHSQAFYAFKNSCAEILKRSPKLKFAAEAEAKYVIHWQRICKAANMTRPSDAKQFFEYWFTPYYVKGNRNQEGLFTGYYLPILRGSSKQTSTYKYPIYGIPSDLIKVNLGLFHPKYTGKYITARWKNNNLVPYPDRKSIMTGLIHKNASIIAWGDSLLDIFFAQIQGSALVSLGKDRTLLIGFAATNGHAYTSIGKYLVLRGELAKEAVSMDSIRSWLINHPKQMHTVLNKNASYVFFKILSQRDPLGTEQVPLTPYRSIAVDTRVIPLGAPIWLDTIVPAFKQNRAFQYQHLMVAQDTGGAIKGVKRGDIYWGTGDKAEFYAGTMQSPGEYWILLPR